MLIDTTDRKEVRQEPEVQPAAPAEGRRSGSSLMLVAIAMGMLAVLFALGALIRAGDREGPTVIKERTAETDATANDAGDHANAGSAAAAGPAPAPTIDEAQGIDFEKYERPDPTLPAPPEGAVKRFEVDVFEHVTQVAKGLAPTEVWSYGINGEFYRGTGASTPMVVTQGDKVEIHLRNGSSEEMNVKMPHSIDYHSSEVAPNVAFRTIEAGESLKFDFVAKHPGVYMYHCATDPLMHTGAGMVGMMVVKPKNMAPVDRELWINQQEFYIGEPGKPGDMAKMQAKQPDVIAFNGYADQYKDHPIEVKKGEKIRMFVLNSGPSIWSAFHVIGTVFDKAVVENDATRHSQTINLAPSQGGWVEFTLDEEGTYPFVTHGFGDMARGAVGVLATENADTGGGDAH